MKTLRDCKLRDIMSNGCCSASVRRSAEIEYNKRHPEGIIPAICHAFLMEDFKNNT